MHKMEKISFMEKKKMLFIYNPRAGKAKIRSNLLDIIDIFTKAGFEVTAYPTQARGDGFTAVTQRRLGFYDIIVCSGGDGTLDEVVTGMMQCDKRLPIGYVPAGSTNDFANSLGIMCSNYESPHGLDSQKHYSSAYDLAILTSKAMKNELFREICGSKTIAKETYGFTRDYQNINKILWKIPNANGVKTGYTGQAGKCLVSSVNHEGRDIIIVVLNCTDRWNQTEKIYNHVCSKYIFKNDSTKNLVESMGMIKLASVLAESDFAYGFKENEKIEIEVFSPIGDVHKGDTLGKLSLYDENAEVTKTGFKASKDLSKECFEEILS